MLIAEVGQNWMGEMTKARALIEFAKENGAHLVKFQLYDYNVLYKGHPEVPDVALSFEQAEGLFEYGQEIGIEVFFSVFDLERIKWCEHIGVKRYKIASRSRKDESLIQALVKTGKPLIISMPFGLGSPYLYGVEVKWDTLWCAPLYPSPAIAFSFPEIDFRHTYQGISDHSIGLDVAKIALSRGAKIIEKHLALNHETGVDAPWSMTPSELKELRRFYDVIQELPELG